MAGQAKGLTSSKVMMTAEGISGEGVVISEEGVVAGRVITSVEDGDDDGEEEAASD